MPAKKGKRAATKGEPEEVKAKVDLPEENEPTEPKKPRAATKKEDSHDEAEEEQVQEKETKRGRGRPKKVDKPAEKAPKGEAKKRGRPRKAAKEETEAAEDSAEEDNGVEEKKPASRAPAKAGRQNKKRGRNAAKEDSAEESDAEEKDLKVSVEHCKSWSIFRRKALELSEALKREWPNIEISYNDSTPRRGAFEFVLKKLDGSDFVLWSGLKRGPPRKEKFPESNIVIESLRKAIWNSYSSVSSVW